MKTQAPKAQNTEPLDQFIYRVSPDIKSVEHMRPLIDALERADRERVRLLVSTPPQHGKSTICFHWLARNMLAPTSAMYLTYSAEIAFFQMRKAKRLAISAGVPFASDSRAVCEWNMTHGGTMTATGVDGTIAGKPGKRIVVDDPIKSPKEAQSYKERETLLEAFRMNVIARAHDDTSIVVVHTRWHPDDLIGTLSREPGWEYVNLPAISYDADGNEKALWPEQRGIEFLHQQKQEMGEYGFSALYQGQPRPRGGHVFEGVHYYDVGPSRYRSAIGIDLAYSAKTQAKSDHSVSLVLAEADGIYYVLDVLRKQVSAPEFGLSLKAHASRYPGSRMVWHAAGSEKGAGDFLIRSGLPLTVEPATTDKFQRAQPVAAAWASGKVLVPRYASWVEPFLREVADFTGVNDYHDDMVDALSSAFSALSTLATGAVLTGNPRTSASLKGYW